MIPKTIFQTYETKYEDLPEHFKQTSLSWKRLNPDWIYVYHDKDQRDRYVKTFSPELYKIYTKIEKPPQAEIWRYLIVKNEGGVWADMDSFCSVPMDYVLKDITNDIDIVCTNTEKILLGTDKQLHTNNANFAAVKESKVLNECINTILQVNEKRKKYPDQDIIHQCFSYAILNNLKIVHRGMRANHGYKYKEAFDQNAIKIDYYGEKISYGKFLTKYA